VVKHSTADPWIASSIPLTSTKITKRRYVLVLPRKKCSRVSVLYTEKVKELGLSCVVGAPVSCTIGHRKRPYHIETNYLYAPTPNGQSPSASLNKSNTPPPVLIVEWSYFIVTTFAHFLILTSQMFKLIQYCVVLCVLCCSICLFCTCHFITVPLNLTCLHCLHQFFNISSIYI